MPLPTDPKTRKSLPIYSGVIRYFPLALAAVAECSRRGNDQHNPGQELFWNRAKSGDELDALVRHLTDHACGELRDEHGVLHLAHAAWRALAALQKELEKQEVASAGPPHVLDLDNMFSYGSGKP